MDHLLGQSGFPPQNFGSLFIVLRTDTRWAARGHLGCTCRGEWAAGSSRGGSAQPLARLTAGHSLLAKGLLPGGVAPGSRDRWISSLDSWEKRPESPVSWLPSLLAECSVSKGPGKLGWGLGEPSWPSSTGGPGWYRHTARARRRCACNTHTAPQKAETPPALLLHLLSPVPPECFSQGFPTV